MFGFKGRGLKKVEKSEEEFKKRLEKEPLEKGDIPALIIAGLIIAIPVLLIVAAIVLFVSWLLFGR